jgi:hypothetical protein
LECLLPEPDTLPVGLEPQQLGPQLRPLEQPPEPVELDNLPRELRLCLCRN